MILHRQTRIRQTLLREVLCVKVRWGQHPVADEVARVAAEAAKTTEAVRTKAYKMPPVSLLNRGSEGRQESDAKLRETARSFRRFWRILE